MADWVQNVIEKWISEGVKLNPPAKIDEIIKAELILSIKLPNDFKKFYLTANGFNGLDWQQHMFSFWPIEMMIDEFSNSDDQDFVSFCDFLLASHCIGFRKTKPGIYKAYPSINYYEIEPIAQTFEQIVFFINSNADIIY